MNRFIFATIIFKFLLANAQIFPVPRAQTTNGNITGKYVTIDPNPFAFKRYSAFLGIP
jgi:hypothetical protein